MPKICLIAGVGINDSDGDVKNNPHYIKWDSMMRRCYKNCNPKTQINYAEIEVKDEWTRFSNFEVWSKQCYSEGLQLDKDILSKGNKIYGPDTCAYVPALVNSILVTHDRARGAYPLGVSKMSKSKGMINERSKPFIAKITDKGKTVNMGYFVTPMEAHQVWQLAKARQIEEVVGWYATQDCFRTDVADALTSRVWQLRLDNSLGVETKEL